MTVQDEVLEIQHSMRACTDCGLCENRISNIYGSWAQTPSDPSTTLMFVTDRMDLKALTHMIVPSGKHRGVLRFILEKMDLVVDNFWITPVTLCPTAILEPDVWPPLEVVPLAKLDQIAACRARLHREVLAIDPEIIIALGNTAVKALYSKKPPKFQTDLGQIREVIIPGRLISRTFPVMITHSLNELYRRENLKSGGTWNQTYNHIQTAHNIAQYLSNLRSRTSG